MKKTKLMFAPLAAMLIAVSAPAISSCSSSSDIRIGILQLVTATPLTAVNESFQATILASDFVAKEGHTVEFTIRNPEANATTMASMAAQLATSSDLILSIATNATLAQKQAITTAGVDIPLIFSAVTDPVGAGIISSASAHDENIAGVSDMGPVDETIDLITNNFDSLPHTLGLIYNTLESNSIAQIATAKTELAAKGWSFEEKTATSTTEVETAMRGFSDSTKIVFYPTDNLMAQSDTVIAQVAKEKELFVACGDSSLVSDGGALFSLGVDYSDLGVQTANVALEVLTDSAIAKDIPLGTASKFPLVVNTALATEWGLTLPASLVSEADEVIS
jgi:putative tryptophan/tyrosine transport system substrate-binding protein